MKRGLTGRMVLASGLLAIIIGAAFALLILAIADLRESTDEQRGTREELVAAESLEKLILDLETGLRGFVITGEERFLEPTRVARASFPAALSELERRAIEEPVALAQVRRIGQAAQSYIRDYAVPLVAAVRRDDPAARSVETTDEGRRRVDALRASLSGFREAERARLRTHEDDANDAAHRAAVAAAIGLVGSILLILLFTGYLTRVMVRPVRRAADLAGRLARGDLAVRMPEGGVGEIGDLERAFNKMGASLEANRDELREVAEEQAALRHVATLVAEDVPPGQLLGAVAEEVGRLLGADFTGMIRYESDDTVTVVATWAARGEHPDLPDRWQSEEGDPAALIAKAHGPVRVSAWEDVPGQLAAFIREMGITSSVGSPIRVEGRLWGALAVHSAGQPLPADTESRLVKFTELVATALANAQSRDEVRRLADEQAALRRVATLVARAVPPEEIFTAVAVEVRTLFGADTAGFARLEPDGLATIVAVSPQVEEVPIGTPMELGSGTAVGGVLRTGGPIRIDDYSEASGPFAEVGNRMGRNSAIGCPILVEDHLWGALVIGSSAEPPTRDAESRLMRFADLAATAIANAESRAELARSRARVVAAADETRRRIERDLHDAAQQRLVHTVVTLKLARRALENGDGDGEELVREALDHAEQANAELRELAHGILPSVLTHSGLRAGVGSIVSRTSLPVTTLVPDERFPPAVEATAYFVISEALTNAVKHSAADRAEVTVQVDGGLLRVEIRDDGAGGARFEAGTGLIGLRDRVSALDGRIEVKSPPGEGTTIVATLPLVS